MRFSQNVETSETVGVDDIVDGKLPFILTRYDGIDLGDTITPWVALQRLDDDAIELDENSVELPFIEIGISEQALFDALDGPRLFTYFVKDKAGNEANANPRLLTIDLNGQPTGLLAPPVPLGADGLIDDADARSPVVVQIPAFDKARRNDEIHLKWGNQTLQPIPLTDEDLLLDPFIEISIPYGTIFTAGNGPQNVIYDVLRNGRLVGVSPATLVDLVDLTLPGGPDPDPTDPVHGNLLPARVQGESGQDNVIPPEDIVQDATAFIPWLGEDDEEVMVEDDIVTLAWGDQPPLPPYPVTAQDVIDKVDLELPVPSATMRLQGSGKIPVAYTIAREIRPGVPPDYNVAPGPAVLVDVTNTDDLPGGSIGLPDPIFSDLNENLAIGRAQIANGYNPVRIPTDYVNARAGDTIELFFVGYDDLFAGNLVPGAAYNPQPPYTLVQADIDRTFYEFQVPSQYHLAVCSRGAVEAHFMARNGFGPATSDKTRVFCDVKLPALPDCSASFGASCSAAEGISRCRRIRGIPAK